MSKSDDTPRLSRFDLMERRQGGPAPQPKYRAGSGEGTAEPTEPTTGRFSGDWMAEVLENARQAGLFENLPGKGKPLDMAADDPVGGEQAKLYQQMKQGGFTPEWVELRPKISAAIVWLRENPQDPNRDARLQEANEMIRRHNGQLPTPALEYPRLPADFGR